MARAGWSCEHCGFGTKTGPYDCEELGCSMCETCCYEADQEAVPCPVAEAEADPQPERGRS